METAILACKSGNRDLVAEYIKEGLDINALVDEYTLLTSLIFEAGNTYIVYYIIIPWLRVVSRARHMGLARETRLRV